MAFDIKGLGGIRGADKTKAKAKTGAAGGPSFADMLDEAQNAGNDSALPAVGGMAGYTGGYIPLDEENLPKDARGQANELLKTLRGLAEDALSGSPTAALSRLEAMTSAVDEASLTPEQKKALDEVRTRAAVEAAKLKS